MKNSTHYRRQQSLYNPIDQGFSQKLEQWFSIGKPIPLSFPTRITNAGIFKARTHLIKE